MAKSSHTVDEGFISSFTGAEISSVRDHEEQQGRHGSSP